MKCPACNTASKGRDVAIREQTATDTGLHQQRRSRRCLSCGHRWDTLEMPLADVLQLRRLAHATVMAAARIGFDIPARNLTVADRQAMSTPCRRKQA